MKKNSFYFLKRTWFYIKEYKSKIYLYTFLTLVTSVLFAIVPYFGAKLVTSISSSLLDQIIYIGGIILVLNILGTILSNLAEKIYYKLFKEMLLKIQLEISSSILDLEVRNFDLKSSGDFIKRLDTDSREMSYVFISISNAIRAIVTNIGVYFIIFLISPVIGLFYLISVSFLFLIQKMRIEKRNKMHATYKKLDDKNNGMFMEMIKGIRDIKVLNINNNFNEYTKSELKKSFDAQYIMDKSNRNFFALDHGTRQIIKFLFLILAVFLIKSGNLVVANFMILYMYQNQLFDLFTAFSELAGDLKEFSLSASRAFEIIDGKVFPKERFGKKKIGKVKGKIEFRDVCFNYDDTKRTIKNMNFTIRPDETVSFVGHSGGGKSTIFSLLTKMYTINSGSILIDGININEFDKDSLRNGISIITQSPYLFNLTVRENLLFVNTDISEEEMFAKCKLACIHDDIMKLRHGYDTRIGEGGVTLSGGQKQRLAIARALLKESEIILLDEATSALDNDTQKKVQEAINNISKDYTVLIIAHRLTTTQNSDKIFVVENGSILDSGTHDTLLLSSTIYKDLYESSLE